MKTYTLIHEFDNVISTGSDTKILDILLALKELGLDRVIEHLYVIDDSTNDETPAAYWAGQF